MKRLVVTIFLVGLAIAGHAQHLDLLIDGGAAKYTQRGLSNGFKGDLCPAVSFKALLKTGVFQIGAGVDYGNLSYTQTIQYNNAPYKIHAYFAAPYISPYLLLNAAINVSGQSYIYIGGNMGVMSTQQNKDDFRHDYTATTTSVISGHNAPLTLPGNGVMYGANTGVMWYFTNKFGANMGLSIRHTTVKNLSCTYYPFMAGLNYRIF